MESFEDLGLEVRLEIPGHLYNNFVSKRSKACSSGLFGQRLLEPYYRNCQTVSSLSPWTFPACSLFYLLLLSSFLLCLWITSAQWANFTQSKICGHSVLLQNEALQPWASCWESSVCRSQNIILEADSFIVPVKFSCQGNLSLQQEQSNFLDSLNQFHGVLQKL